MLARLLPLVVLLMLSACSGARLGPADGSPEAVWAELVALAVSPNPDMDAVAERTMYLLDDVPQPVDPEEALTRLRAVLPFSDGDRVDYTVASRYDYSGDAGAFTQLQIRFDRFPGRTVYAVFIQRPDQDRPAYLL